MVLIPNLKDCHNPNPYNSKIMNAQEYNKYLDSFQ